MLLQSVMFYLEQAFLKRKLSYDMSGNRASRPEIMHTM